MKKLVIDLDYTLTMGKGPNGYSDAIPNIPVIEKLKECHEAGFGVIIHTARNMRTYAGDVDKIKVHTLPVILSWLEKHEIPYEEIRVGKPRCGEDGYYVDDKSIRPREFRELSHDEIVTLLERDR